MTIIHLFNKKAIVLVVIVVFSFQYNFAQGVKSDFWENVRFGGGLGLNFGSGFFSATVAPSAVYEFNSSVSLGFGLNATFNSQKNAYKSTILGGSLIGLFNPMPGIQLSSEFEQLNVNRRYDDSYGAENENYWIPALYLGAGYRNGNVTFGIRYDVLFDKEKSIYVDPWAPFVRFYF